MTTDPTEEARRILTEGVARAAVLLLASYAGMSEETEPGGLILAALRGLPKGSIRGKKNTRVVEYISLLVPRLPEDHPRRAEIEQLYRQAQARVKS